ncbi:MAG: glycine cleavage system aminomethyltransferase GcvT [Spirochaetota bacterium]
MRTPLYTWHRSHGAKIVSFAGWDMPLHYTAGAIEEHHLVRRSVGLFDISHMGRLVFSGSGAASELDRLVSSDILSLQPRMSTYGLLCREDGTVIDDVFIYRFDGEYLMVVNAANRERDTRWINEHLHSSAVSWSDESERLSMIAVQGPNAIDVANGLASEAVAAIPRFGCGLVTLSGVNMRCGRTGYTGEDGVELFLPVEHAESVWESFFEYAAGHGIELGPCGLAARDSLRFEPGFHLYGHELGDSITPVEARLKWACHFDRDFIGRDAILSRAREGPERRLVTIVMADRGVPREGYRILDPEGRDIGEVVSGMYAPTVGEYAANAFVKRGFTRTGTRLRVDVRGREKTAEVVKRPLYTPRYKETGGKDETR